MHSIYTLMIYQLYLAINSVVEMILSLTKEYYK